MNAKKYLDKLKRRLGVGSDYALAQRLGVTRACISNYRRGVSVFDNAMVTTVAEKLGMSLREVLADVEHERGNVELSRRIRRLAAVLAVAAYTGVFDFALDAAMRGTAC